MVYWGLSSTSTMEVKRLTLVGKSADLANEGGVFGSVLVCILQIVDKALGCLLFWCTSTFCFDISSINSWRLWIIREYKNCSCLDQEIE